MSFYFFYWLTNFFVQTTKGNADKTICDYMKLNMTTIPWAFYFPNHWKTIFFLIPQIFLNRFNLFIAI